MLAEGLDGDPVPARKDLAISAAPFTVEHIRPLVANARSAAHGISGASFTLLLSLAFSSIAIALGVVSNKWTGMTVAMGFALVGALMLPSVRRQVKPSSFQVALGVAAGVVLYGLTRIVAGILFSVWPESEALVGGLYAWKAGHSSLFLGVSLIMIVFAEEVLWRGVVSRFLMERCGRVTGIVSAAAIYALAHWAAFNPLLLLAAFCCGLYWGCLYAAGNNLISPAVSHLVWDALLLFAFPIVRI
jgi:membrane protease YdiL (CAAX protease family)